MEQTFHKIRLTKQKTEGTIFMKKIVCIVFVVVFSFSPVTLADAPLWEDGIISDLVYRGEEWEFHDLVYREEPIEAIVLPFQEAIPE